MAPKRPNGTMRPDLMKHSSLKDLKDVKDMITTILSSKGLFETGESEEESLDDGLEKYKYLPLKKPKSIRLLKLHMAGKKSQGIECELSEEDLNLNPKYEALSWSWGDESWDKTIRVLHGGKAYRFAVPRTLVEALRALRLRNEHRILWVDAICIDQRNYDEKNKQVPMMSDIYGLASGVCIYIGEENEHSKIALDFIKKEVLRLQEFDELCEDEEASPKWRAMLDVMKSPWFSRRWVVQEIALANEATIYCGDQTIPWKDFSDAVQLFVEVESATHRLSEVMKKDPQFFHVPGWFEYVSALGASLLVNATGTLFRKTKDQRREPLLSLEYLVSSMTVFEATVAHDTIYSLLAIARDTEPVPVIHAASETSELPAQKQLKAWASRHAVRKPYRVDYQLPLIDVCQEFIAFCIQQSDPTRALDIICRPWAPVLDPEEQRELEMKKRQGHKEPRHIEVNKDFAEMPSWIPTLSGAAHAIHPHATGELRMGRQNADALVGLPDYSQRNYNAAGTTKIDEFGLRFKKYKNYYSMSVSGFVCDEVTKVLQRSQSGNIPKEWIKEGRWIRFTEDPPEELWRTLVADRGRNGKNPPTYYARACKESIHKGLKSGSLNTMELIEHGRCSVVAEFFRRVQAVIWNRSLMRTKRDALGIVNENAKEGDLVCVLYGCSVPVILRRHQKDPDMIAQEEREFEEDRKKATLKLQSIYRDRKELRKQNEAKRASREPSLITRTNTAWSNETLSDKGQQGAFLDHSTAVQPSASSLEDDQTHDRVHSESLNISHENGMPTQPESLPLTEWKDVYKPTPPPKPANLSEGSGIGGTRASAAIPETNGVNEIVLDDSESVETVDNEGDEAQGLLAMEDLKRETSKAERRKYWYEFVGECYVHGMMDGEAIKYQNENRVLAEMFELR